MTAILVHTPFRLTLDDGSTRDFRAGEHVVDEGVAAHWYVRAHSEVSARKNPESRQSTQPDTEAPALSAELAPARKKKNK